MSMRKLDDNSYMFEFPYEKIEKYFDGASFLKKYQNAQFLLDFNNIQKLLSNGEDLRNCEQQLAPGEQLTIDRMFIKSGVPLILKKSGCPNESDIPDDDFTVRRLMGLIAAVASMHANKLAPLLNPEAEALGLAWGKERIQQQLYLAAVSGAEYFINQFETLPLICALRKFQLKMISEKEIRRVAKIPHRVGVPIAQTLWHDVRYGAHKVYEIEGLFVYNDKPSFDTQKALDRLPEIGRV